MAHYARHLDVEQLDFWTLPGVPRQPSPVTEIIAGIAKVGWLIIVVQGAEDWANLLNKIRPLNIRPPRKLFKRNQAYIKDVVANCFRRFINGPQYEAAVIGVYHDILNS